MFCFQKIIVSCRRAGQGEVSLVPHQPGPDEMILRSANHRAGVLISDKEKFRPVVTRHCKPLKSRLVFRKLLLYLQCLIGVRHVLCRRSRLLKSGPTIARRFAQNSPDREPHGCWTCVPRSFLQRAGSVSIDSLTHTILCQDITCIIEVVGKVTD